MTEQQLRTRILAFLLAFLLQQTADASIPWSAGISAKRGVTFKTLMAQQLRMCTPMRGEQQGTCSVASNSAAAAVELSRNLRL
jgi:hypothetical protein